jgi:hypothetical protein
VQARRPAKCVLLSFNVTGLRATALIIQLNHFCTTSAKFAKTTSLLSGSQAHMARVPSRGPTHYTILALACLLSSAISSYQLFPLLFKERQIK